jgi:23S rRNA pseudouridine1911/1915/1917 synthase
MRYTLRENLSLLDAVLKVYHGVSKQKAKQIISHSQFLKNGQPIDRHPKQMLEKGDVLEIVKSENTQTTNLVPSHRQPVVIQFEDEYILVSLKPAGIISCSSKTDKKSKSFHNVLEAYLYKRDEKRTKLWVIHRLDKEVEGLILFAKSEEIQQKIKENWQHVVKKYLALTEGKPNPESGTIENWLHDTPGQKVIATKHEVPESKFAKTEYNYIRQEKKYHLLEIQIYTGRKNQIRVHLSGMGCAIVGDRKYGANDKIKRQIRLAAYKMELMHPVNKTKIVLSYTPPSRFFKPSEKENELYKIL